MRHSAVLLVALAVGSASADPLPAQADRVVDYQHQRQARSRRRAN